MAEGAIQAKSHIDRGIGFRQPVRKVSEVECEIHSRKAGKISGRQPCPLYLRLCDVKSTRGNAAESERTCAYDQTAKPCTRSATRIEQPDRACTGSPQVSQFCLQDGPDAPICVCVHSVEGEWLRGIAIGITDIIVTSLVVDIGNIVCCLIINCQDRMPNSVRDGQMCRPSPRRDRIVVNQGELSIDYL